MPKQPCSYIDTKLGYSICSYIRIFVYTTTKSHYGTDLMQRRNCSCVRVQKSASASANT